MTPTSRDTPTVPCPYNHAPFNQVRLISHPKETITLTCDEATVRSLVLAYGHTAEAKAHNNSIIEKIINNIFSVKKEEYSTHFLAIYAAIKNSSSTRNKLCNSFLKGIQAYHQAPKHSPERALNHYFVIFYLICKDASALPMSELPSLQALSKKKSLGCLYGPLIVIVTLKKLTASVSVRVTKVIYTNAAQLTSVADFSPLSPYKPIEVEEVKVERTCTLPFGSQILANIQTAEGALARTIEQLREDAAIESKAGEICDTFDLERASADNVAEAQQAAQTAIDQQIQTFFEAAEHTKIQRLAKQEHKALKNTLDDQRTALFEAFTQRHQSAAETLAEQTKAVVTLPKQKAKDYAETLFNLGIKEHREADFRAILDVGAHFSGEPNEATARRLAELVKSAKSSMVEQLNHILFFNEAGQLAAIPCADPDADAIILPSDVHERDKQFNLLALFNRSIGLAPIKTTLTNLKTDLLKSWDKAMREAGFKGNAADKVTLTNKLDALVTLGIRICKSQYKTPSAVDTGAQVETQVQVQTKVKEHRSSHTPGLLPTKIDSRWLKEFLLPTSWFSNSPASPQEEKRLRPYITLKIPFSISQEKYTNWMKDQFNLSTFLSLDTPYHHCLLLT